MQTNKSMTWYKVLIYFLLFASALVYLYHSFFFFSGNLHKNHEKLFYFMAPHLKTFDIIMGILYILLAALAIYTRIELVKFSKIAPMLLTGVYLAPAICKALYLIVLMSTKSIGQDFDVLTYDFVPAIFSSVALLGINLVYMTNRSEMFTN